VVKQPISPWALFATWLALGAQSWGGGAATLLMIRREVVERRGWMSAEEFTRSWSICQVTPGINLLGLTVLIGWRLGRVWGVLLSLLGLLLPSVAITVLLTAAYASVREQPAVRSALRGVVPATVGLGLLLIWQLGVPLIRQAEGESRASLLVALALFLGSALVSFVWQPPVIFILLGAGLLGAIYGWLSAGPKA
jgi:chromate transporter